MTRRYILRFLAGCFVAGAALMPSSARATGYSLVNPGIKLGYTWGPGGGFTIGLEASALQFEEPDDFMYGPVINFDYRWGHDFRLRLGIEGCRTGFGIEGGVVASFESGNLRFGLAATPWIGVVFVSHYTITYLFDGHLSHEIGGYVKAPFLNDGYRWETPIEVFTPDIAD